MALGVSVIICCYNSETKLPETLKHLALQEVQPEISWEIIIIDNASTDDTALTSKEEWDKYRLAGVELKIFDEPIPGLSNAREKGIRVAQYEYLLFCDDDNWLFPEYVSTAYKIMSADPKIGILGGCGIFFPEQPSWPEIEKYKISYVNGPQTWAATDHWVYGAGSVCRKSVLQNLYRNGWRQITTDRVGKKLTAGGDVEICLMIHLSGHKIIANERLLFRHFVPLKRQNFRYLLNLHFWEAYSYVLLYPYFQVIHEEKTGIQKKIDDGLIYNAKALIKLFIKIIAQGVTEMKGINFNQRIALQSYCGAIFSIYKNRKKIIGHARHLEELLNKSKNAHPLISG